MSSSKEAVSRATPEGSTSRVKIASPPPFVRTIGDLIDWEYAKLIARSSGAYSNNYGFITSRYKKLKSGEIKWSDRREDTKKQQGRAPKCEYCGAMEGPFTNDHIIPLVKGGLDDPDNIVLACKSCNSSKNDNDVFYWYYVVRGEKELPKLVISKYLKLVFESHQFRRTLERTDINGDGVLNVLDLGDIFKKYSDLR